MRFVGVVFVGASFVSKIPWPVVLVVASLLVVDAMVLFARAVARGVPGGR